MNAVMCDLRKLARKLYASIRVALAQLKIRRKSFPNPRYALNLLQLIFSYRGFGENHTCRILARLQCTNVHIYIKLYKKPAS
eukprot:SAG11_NODE_25070_length_364_cov_0.720755_1_plen_81_part_10